MKKLLTAIAFLLATVSLAACSLFQGKSIDGEWTSTTAGEAILAEGLAEVEAEEMFTYSEHRFSEVLTGSTVNLSVAEGKAVMTMAMTVDREAFFTAMKDETAATMKAGLEEEGLTYDELDDESKALFDATMLTDEVLYDMVDQAFEAMAKEMDGTYDKEAGKISATLFKGTVDRSKKVIQITEINETSGQNLGEDDLQSYTLEDKVLILEGAQDGEDMVFELKK